MEIRQIPEQLVATARRMLADGLVTLTAGNLSARMPGRDLVAITPSHRPYDTMKPEDVPIVDLDGRLVEGAHQPSAETPMHTMIYRARPDVHAVVHTHSPYALAFAVVHRPIPLVCTEGLPVGAMWVPLADYATPGTEEIGLRTLEALDRHPGCLAALLANHGLVALGRSLAEAYAVARAVEAEARVYHLALGVGTPVPMTEEQVTAIRRRYRSG